MIRKQITAIAAILAERERQVAVEGWTAAHDDTHVEGELVAAARCYFELVTERPPASWPFDAAAWKPKDRRRNLERAGAFLMAEADRIVRFNEKATANEAGEIIEIDGSGLQEKLRMVVEELDAINARELAVETGDISFRAPDVDPADENPPMSEGGVTLGAAVAAGAGKKGGKK